MATKTCDRCGPTVAAQVTVDLPSGKKLDFCNHCFNKYTAAIIAKTLEESSTPTIGAQK